MSRKDFKNTMNANVPSNFKLLEFQWYLDDQAIAMDSTKLEYDYKKPGSYKIKYYMLALCDTSLNPLVATDSIQNILPEFSFPIDFSSVAGNKKVFSATDIVNWKGVLSKEQLMALGFNMNPVLFDLNKSNVRKDAEEIILENEKIIKKYPQLKVKITGFTDSRGSERRNTILSNGRAEVVKKHLIKFGIKKSQIISSQGSAENKLVNDCGKGVNCDESAHQQNRRIEMEIRIGEK